MAADVGTGSTLTIGNFTAHIISISHGGLERASVPTSHLGTSGGQTFLEGDTYDPGSVDVEYHVDTEDPDSNLNKAPYLDAAADLTINLPLATGDSTAAKVVASGFVTSASPLTINFEELVVGSMTIKLSGDLVWTNAS